MSCAAARSEPSVRPRLGEGPASYVARMVVGVVMVAFGMIFLWVASQPAILRRTDDARERMGLKRQGRFAQGTLIALGLAGIAIGVLQILG